MLRHRKSPLTGVLILIVALCLIFSPAPAPLEAQTTSGGVTLAVEAGFDGAFRDQQWMPVVIRARNNGLAVRGRLVIRPETSGSGITGIYSTPVELPEGAAQTVILDITARGMASSVRVELLDEEGLVVASAPATLRAIQAQDRLHVVVTESPVGAVDLGAVRFGNFAAFQATWTPAELPDRAAVLDSVDLILINDADMSALTEAQRDALSAWVTAGGHLIVAGGTNWQSTVSGLEPLLPITPNDSTTTGSIRALAEWVVLPAENAAALDRDTVLATGSLKDGARVLVSDANDIPILSRWSFGGGTVDYLAVDPLSQPLRGWDGLNALWLTLVTTLPPQPGWSNGFTDWDQAISAVQILPGFDPLPDVLPLCGFLIGYIALIGPLNYAILARINRREWAWFTIPIMIAAFTVISFVIGGNLRGSEATLNRLTVVRAWEDREVARVDSIVGLLSPRREQYTLTAEDGETLRAIPRTTTGGTFIANSQQAAVDVSQSDVFSAQNFVVDASFIAPFTLAGAGIAPAVSGSATFTYDDQIDGQQNVRGSVTNGSDLTLFNPVILARGVAYELGESLAAGDVLTFNLTLAGEGTPAPLMRYPSPAAVYQPYRSYQYAVNEQSAIDILGTERFSTAVYTRSFAQAQAEDQEWRRRQFLLTSMIDDTWGSTGRGDEVYFAAWSNAQTVNLALDGADWNAQDSTLWLVQLARTVEKPTNRPIMIPPERFTWVTLDQQGIGEIAPVDINMQAGEYAVFRFTPLEDAVLSVVESLTLTLGNINSGGRSIPVEIYNRVTGEWERMTIVNGARDITDPAPYLGTANAVELRLEADSVGGGFLRIGRIGIQQRGSF